MHNKYYTYPLRCYAAWSEDPLARQKCASGGFVSLLSQHVIAKRGVVYGVRYNEDWQAVYAKASSLQELEAFKGSKYAYARVGDIYYQVKADIDQHRLVLFVGLPCQVAALYAFLGDNPNQLITCDLFCHGAPPTDYLSEEIRYLKKKHHLSEIDDVRFRGNDGNNYYLTLWNKGELLYKKKAQAQYYFKAFLSGLSLRDACQQCRYARVERVGDLSAGDFIGLGKEHPFEGPLYNTSVVLVNRPEMEVLLSEILLQYPTFKWIERDLQEAAKWGPALNNRRDRNAHSSAFHRAVKSKGWVRISRSMQRMAMLQYYWRSVYQWCHHQGYLVKCFFKSK